MSEWKETRFGDFVVFNPRVKLTKGKEYRFILMEEIEPKVKFINSSSTKVYDGSGAKFENGDILFARITPSLENGKIAQVSKIKRAGFGSTELYVFREKPNVSDKDFIYYMVRADFFIQNAVNSYVGASGRQRADAGFIANTILKLPELPTQHRIAYILSAYDDLIENNNRRIALLEQMAEQIYKEWFVRMRFPGYQNTEFEKGVPKGWANIDFRDFIKLNRGFDLPEDKIIEGIYPIVASTSIKAYHNHYKVEAPCIVTGRSGSLGTVQYVNKKAWPLNTSLYVKDFKGNSPQFVFYFLKSIKLENFNCGAGVPTLNQNHLHMLRLFCPSKEIQRKFDDLIIPIFNEVENLQLQTQTLKQTRDLLLPRLISGKLKVNELKEFELV